MQSQGMEPSLDEFSEVTRTGSDQRVEMQDLTYDEIVEIEDRHTSGASVKRPIALERGLGSTVWDSAGKAYLDFTSGQGVANVGHNHPFVVQAIKDQLDKLLVCADAFYHSERAQLLDELLSITPADISQAFLANSGAEAVETAFKLARVLTGKTGIIALKRAFHGRTTGALAATWNPRYKNGFHPLLPDVVHIGYDAVDDLDQALDGNTAAVIIELIQGEAGIWPLAPEMISAASRLCRERGALLIVDEIQTGFGRTGSMFAYEWADLVPDIMCLGKAIAGGLPMSAVLWRGSLGRFDPGTHGSTFGGFPLVSAAARAVLKVIHEEQLVQRSAQLGDYLLRGLTAIDSPLIRAIRGRGLMVGIDLRIKAAPVVRGLTEKGILVLRSGSTIIRLLPPLVVTKEEIDRLVSAIDEILKDIVK